MKDLRNRGNYFIFNNNSFLRKRKEILFCFNLESVQNWIEFANHKMTQNTEIDLLSIQSLYNIKNDCFGCYNFSGSYGIKSVYAA